MIVAAPTRRHRSRGSIDTLPSGALRVRVYAGVDPLTRRRRDLVEIIPAGPTAAKKAERVRIRLLNQVDESRAPRSSITVAAAIDAWLKVNGQTESTKERNEYLIRDYIRPTLGDLPAGKLDAELLEHFYARLGTCRGLCDGRARRGHTCRPLAPNTIRKIHFLLSGALDRAVRWNYLAVNPVSLAEPPAFEASEPDPPTAAEAAALLNEAWRDPAWGLLLWLAMVTGWRRGELCSLRWHRVDTERRVLAVAREDTKSRKERRVSIDSRTAALLAAHRAELDHVCAALGIDPDPDAYVFTTSPDGSTPLLPESITQRYRRLARRLKLRSTRLHSLRHYSATELVAAGVDLRTVAGRLGHASASTTLRIYAAWVEEADRTAADTIANIVPQPNPAARPPRSPYEHLAAALRADITSGTYSTDDQLPTVADLASDHNVSVGTVNRAFSLLRDEGLITVSRGRRATVREPDSGTPAEQVDSTSADQSDGTVLLDLELRHHDQVVKRFRTEANPNDPAQLRRLLTDAVRRHSGDDRNLIDYELDIYLAGRSKVLMTYVGMVRP